MIKIIPAVAFAVICWGIWAVKSFLYCKKNGTPVKLKLKELWNNPFWIGPEKLLNVREKLVLAIIAIRFAYETLSFLSDAPFNNKRYICISFLLIYIFVFGRFNLKQYILFGISTVLFSFGYYNIVLFCVVAVFDIGAEKIIKVLFAALTVIYGFSIILSSVGIISTGDMTTEFTRGTSEGPVSVRHSLGFGHPNYAGLFFALWLILYFAIRYPKIKWWDWIIGVAALGVITFVIDSRSAMILTFIFLVLIFFAKYCPKIYDVKLFKFAFIAVPIICVLLSVFATYRYNPQNAVWDKINSLLTGRIYLMSSAAMKVPLSLFSNAMYSSDKSGSFIDCFYIDFLLYNGIIPLIILTSLYVFLIYRLYKLKAYPEIALVTSYLIYYCVEKRFFQPFVNITFFLFVFIFSSENRCFIFQKENTVENRHIFSCKKSGQNIKIKEE